MNVVKLLSTILLTLTLAACASVPVKVDSDPAQDFSSYSTFSWTGKSPMIANKTDHSIPPVAEDRMTAALKNTLEQKGYRFVEDASAADFAVSYTIGARDKIQLESYAPRYYGGYDNWTWGFPYYGYGYNRFPMQYRSGVVEQKEYVRGSLAVDMFDVKRRSPVWHGYGSKRLSDEDLLRNASDADETMANMLAEFPSKTAS